MITYLCLLEFSDHILFLKTCDKKNSFVSPDGMEYNSYQITITLTLPPTMSKSCYFFYSNRISIYSQTEVYKFKQGIHKKKSNF